MTTTAPAIWFAPNETSTMLTNMETAPATFQAEMAGVSVVKLYEVTLALRPDAELKTFFSYLNAHGIELAIEGMPLVATQGQPGYGVESFSEQPTDLNVLLTKAKNDGANVSYMAWDEPMTYGYEATGYLTPAQTAAEVVHANGTVRALFPDVKIGDIEPVGGSNSLGIISQWDAVYARASGSQFDFFQEDIQATDTGWQTQVEQVTQAGQAAGMQVMAIVDGFWNASSNDQWVSEAFATAQALTEMAGAVPNVLVVQSWNPYPSNVDDPSQPGTLAGLLGQVETLAAPVTIDPSPPVVVPPAAPAPAPARHHWHWHWWH